MTVGKLRVQYILQAMQYIHQSALSVCVFCCREPKGLKLLIQLYVERSHSLWKEPEVIYLLVMLQHLVSITTCQVVCTLLGVLCK